MKYSFVLCISILAIVLLLPSTLCAQADETSSNIPALTEFHEVMMPMWHQAYPEKNFILLKELAPKVAAFAKELPAVTLPGILRDKKLKWDTGGKAFVAATTELVEAVKTKKADAIKEAVEKTHAKYQGVEKIFE